MLATRLHQYYEGGHINYNSIKTRKINKIKRKPINSFFLRDICGTFAEHSRNIRGTFAEHSQKKLFMGFLWCFLVFVCFFSVYDFIQSHDGDHL